MKKEKSKMMDYLWGKEVIVMTSNTQKVDDHHGKMESSVSHRGVLLDEDDIYVYLGFTEDVISTLVAKTSITSIMDFAVYEAEDNLQNMFSGMPDDPEKLN